MEIASAKIQQKGKGEDRVLVRPLDETGSVQLLAVADGLSLRGGKAAAKWVIDCLKGLNEIDTPRSIYKAINRELQQSRHTTRQSETTLTCGILREVCEEDVFLRFDYFAIGDSPIWKVIVGDARYPFQRILVHGPPYPAETARVYSTLRLHQQDITGVVTFGAIEVARGEVLVVCTDGIPEREVFVRDFSNSSEGIGSPRLCKWLFEQRSYSDDKLRRVLKNYDDRGILFDDATIIAARLTPIFIDCKDSRSERPEMVASEDNLDVCSHEPRPQPIHGNTEWSNLQLSNAHNRLSDVSSSSERELLNKTGGPQADEDTLGSNLVNNHSSRTSRGARQDITNIIDETKYSSHQEEDKKAETSSEEA